MNPILIDKALTIAIMVLDYLITRPDALEPVRAALKRMEEEGRKDITSEDVKLAMQSAEAAVAAWKQSNKPAQ